MASPYDTFVPFEPVRADLIPPELQGRTTRDAARSRVVHSTHDSVEFEGKPEECIEFIGRAWWQTLFQDGPKEDSNRQFYAAALTLENWNGQSWQLDEETTRTIMATYDVDEEPRVL